MAFHILHFFKVKILMHIIYPFFCLQGEDVVLGNTPSSDNHEGMEDGGKKQGGQEKRLGGSDKKIGSVQEKLDWISVSTSGNVPRARYHVCRPQQRYERVLKE